MTTIERHYDTTPEHVWRLWTTADGIESWWAPDGFAVRVAKIQVEPGGELVYTMTATAPEQIEFMNSAGMPLATESRKRFTELTEHRRIAYQSLVDFVPDVEPYEFLTVVDIQPNGAGADVRMTIEPMHDDVWTQRLTMGRTNELDNLARVIG